MELNEILTIVSLIASIASIILAIVAISLSKNASKDSKDNFKETQTLQNQTYEKTKDLLHEINIKSAVINEVVQKNQTQLTTLFTNVLDRLLNTPSLEEKIEYAKKEPESLQDKHMNQLAMQLLPELIKNPDSLTKIVEVSEQLKSMK